MTGCDLMGLKIKTLNCELTCDVCNRKISLEQKVVKLDLEKGKVHTSIADVTVRISPIFTGDSNCQVIAVNCTENKILCNECAEIYRNREDSLRCAYKERIDVNNMLQFVREQI
jgi:hypothetical protein